MVVVPGRVRPGQAARVHVIFRPGAASTARWNNESTPLRVWVSGAEGWTISSRLLTAPQGDQPESVEVRRLEFEVKAPPVAEGKLASRLTPCTIHARWREDVAFSSVRTCRSR